MKTSTISPVPDYSLSTLEVTVRRALDFLRGVGSTPVIIHLMTQAGYTANAHREGQRLLSDVVAFVQGGQSLFTVTSSAHTAAIDELTSWEKTVFRRLRVAATRFYPDDAEAIFGNLKISDKMDVALLVKIFLERMASSSGAKSRKAPSGILKLFAQRGFGAEEIAHLNKLVRITEAPAAEDSAEVLDETERAAQKATRLEMLTALRGWYDDWAETARSVLVRRDHLIRVGLAQRKTRALAVVAPPVKPAAPPVTPTTPSPAPSSADVAPDSRAA